LGWVSVVYTYPKGESPARATPQSAATAPPINNAIPPARINLIPVSLVRYSFLCQSRTWLTRRVQSHLDERNDNRSHFCCQRAMQRESRLKNNVQKV